MQKEQQDNIDNIKQKLKELTGTDDLNTIKTFLVKDFLVPDYKLQVENYVNRLENIKSRF